MRIIALIVFILSLLPAQSRAQQLRDDNDCMNIGGQWTPGGGPSRLGRCEFQQNFTVQRNQRLEVGPSIDLVFSNQSQLINLGEVNVSDFAHVWIESGSLTNDGLLYLDNDAELTLKSGFISNDGEILSEGQIQIESIQNGQNGLYNRGLVTITHGGNLVNHGLVISHTNGYMVIGRDGKFYNEAGGSYLPKNDEIYGSLINRWGGMVDNEKILTIRSGGHFENSGQMWNAGLGIPNENGEDNAGILIGERDSTIVNRSGGNIDNYEGRILVAGTLTNLSATINNLNNGEIETSASGAIEITGNGVIYNRPGGVVDNLGSIRVHCFANYVEQSVFRNKPIYYVKCGPVPNIPPPRLPW